MQTSSSCVRSIVTSPVTASHAHKTSLTALSGGVLYLQAQESHDTSPLVQRNNASEKNGGCSTLPTHGLFSWPYRVATRPLSVCKILHPAVKQRLSVTGRLDQGHDDRRSTESTGGSSPDHRNFALTRRPTDSCTRWFSPAALTETRLGKIYYMARCSSMNKADR